MRLNCVLDGENCKYFNRAYRRCERDHIEAYASVGGNPLACSEYEQRIEEPDNGLCVICGDPHHVVYSYEDELRRVCGHCRNIVEYAAPVLNGKAATLAVLKALADRARENTL